MKGYKAFWLDADNNYYTGGMGGSQYTKWEIGETKRVSGHPALCENGFHFFREKNFCFAFNFYSGYSGVNRICEVEVKGEIEEDTFKCVCTDIKLVRDVTDELIQEVDDKFNSGSGNSGNRNSGYVNSGNKNSGHGNSGDENLGNWNSRHMNFGDRNSGNWNSGHGNSGNMNSGNKNSGNENSGSWNSGDRNSGNGNSGHGNSGRGNSGRGNSGNGNSGNWNSGNRNSGNENSGNWNSGDKNSGDNNSGHGNSGNENSGDRNSGDRNSGHGNSGHGNSGHGNSGHGNSGNGNSGSWNSGIFNTNEPKMRAFNKEANMTFSEWVGSDKYINFNLDSYNMSYKEAWAEWWNNNKSKGMRQRIKNLPNFDRNIFYEITGIDVDRD